MPQFSLRSLLFVVVIAAVGCAALVYPTEMWRQVVVTMTVLLLTFSTLAAVFAQGRLRVCSGGFALAGWLYFLLVFSSPFGTREYLLTTDLLEVLGEAIHGEPVPAPTSVPFSPYRGWFVTGSDMSTVRLWSLNGRNSNFHNIGHALGTSVFGVIGSFVAGWLSQRATRKP